MFTQISQLMTNANLNGMHFMIRRSAQGRLSVVVSCEHNAGECNNPDLKAAFAASLHLEGLVSELEQSFISHFSQYGESFTQASLNANTQEVTQALDKQVSANTATNTAQAGSDADKATDTETLPAPDDDQVEFALPDDDDGSL